MKKQHVWDALSQMPAGSAVVIFWIVFLEVNDSCRSFHLSIKKKRSDLNEFDIDNSCLHEYSPSPSQYLIDAPLAAVTALSPCGVSFLHGHCSDRFTAVSYSFHFFMTDLTALQGVFRDFNIFLFPTL